MEEGLIYKAFGLNWYSNILKIPELNIANGYKKDVVIDTRNSFSNESKSFLGVKDQHFCLNIKDLANFEMIDGKKITINSSQDCNHDALRSFLLGSVMGGILIQRNILLLHGNALEKSGKVIICLGESGIGKSTISYLLMLRGWKLLADDLVAINENGFVLPGIPRIKLWKDTIEALNLDFSKFRHLHFYEDKYVVEIEKNRLSLKSNKLSKIFFLNKMNFISEELVKPKLIENERENMKYLKKNLYRPEYITRMKNEYLYFSKLAKLAKNIPCFYLDIPKKFSILKNIIDSNF